MHTDDKSLIDRFQGGDEFAFISLYNRYKAPVYAFCAKMLLNRELAQDVLQDTFLRVYENRERLMHADSFRAWIFTIARNQCLNQLRRQARQVPLESEEAENAVAVELDTPFALLEKSEQIEMVNRFLGALSPDYREVLVLREYQNLSYDDIAVITRSTVSSVKSRLFKARRKLSRFLAPHVGADPAPADRKNP